MFQGLPSDLLMKYWLARALKTVSIAIKHQKTYTNVYGNNIISIAKDGNYSSKRVICLVMKIKADCPKKCDLRVLWDFCPLRLSWVP